MSVGRGVPESLFETDAGSWKDGASGGPVQVQNDDRASVEINFDWLY